jgi:phosphoribosylanthranilate isomerase
MHTRIKICGITDPADAELAVSIGAAMIGVNFYVKSPRYVDDARAKSIVGAIPTTVEAVGVFVSEPWRNAAHFAALLGIHTVQMHGEFGPIPQGVRAIPAFAMRGAESLQEIVAFLERHRAIGVTPSAILIDAHVPGVYGGTGKTAPWQLLADFKPSVPLILAGGLTPDNVAEAIRIVKPLAVDVASGVESSPGKKDADKMRRFIDAVRGA